jgi:hypothetical protein
MGTQQVLAGSANGQVGPVREPPILPVAQEFMMKIKKARLTHKDVKNEDRPDYVYENKGEFDKMDENLSGFLAENTQIER